MLKSYNNIFKNKHNCIRASGEISILVNEAYPYEEIPIASRFEVVAISITLESKTSLCNIYIPNQTDFKIGVIVNIINQLPHPAIIVGDFNSHSTT